jgi:hypothetical protein
MISGKLREKSYKQPFQRKKTLHKPKVLKCFRQKQIQLGSESRQQ